ncbi:hypothetical protein EMIHUDRAFT_356668, partial [Emiliania huxleyi CCMP1516]|uniref:AP2/ERF domain-containing protein n=2 Tax=Emiliania huxleyi TaxID=2903 RepID=A0A0D3IT56_EMIH1
ARHGHQGRRRVRGAVPRLGQAARAPRDGARLALAGLGRHLEAADAFDAAAAKCTGAEAAPGGMHGSGAKARGETETLPRLPETSRPFRDPSETLPRPFRDASLPPSPPCARAEYGRLATAQREFAAEAEKKAEEARLVEAEKAERRRREAQQREARCSRDVAEMQPRCSRGVAGV